MSSLCRCLFIGLPVSGEVRRILEHYSETLPSCRRVSGDLYHITVCFLGMCPPERIPDLCHILDGCPAPELRLSIGATGSFKDGDILWAGLKETPAALRQIYSYLTEMLNLPEDEYTPHITLARRAKGIPAGQTLPDVSFSPDRLILFESTRSDEKHVYLPLYSVPLGKESTQMSVSNDLRSMEILPTDTVLFHTSMKAIGPYPGGADALLEELQEYFRPGLLVFPSLSYNLAGREERIFDPETTPSCIGLLPEMFRKRPGVIRSIHPTHSVSACGPDAADFVAGHENTGTPCARTSPWEKLVERNATIIMAGCDINHCTWLHGVEEWVLPGSHIGKPLEFTLKMPDGSLRKTMSCPHRGSPSEQFWKVEEALEKGGALRRGKIGNADSLFINTRRALDIVSPILVKNPLIFNAAEDC